MSKLLLIITLFSSSSFAQIINEICPSNTEVHEDFFAGFLDWIEIYNPTDSPLSLEGYTMSDDLSDPAQWSFPSITMPPEGFLTITAADDPVLPQTIGFAFPRRGATIYMFSPSSELIDSIAYPGLEPNHSYGLIDSHYYFFDTPSPGDPNNTEMGFKGYANAPNINLVSGAYSAETEIVFTPVLPSETVYYSYNGSNPEAAVLYESPFEIEYTKSIRAIARADSMINSPSVYRTYFVNEHHDLPVVNIGVDSLDLFDNETGIFMMGPHAIATPPHLGANFWEDKEVHVYYEYFDADFELDDAMNCHIEVFGGIGSRWRAMKSIQLRGKNTYDKTYFTYQYFDEKDIDKFRRLVLRNGGNDFCNSCMKDAALHNYFIQSDLNVDLMAYNPVVVYINGHYWGIQNMREKADRYYIQSNYGLDSDEVNLLGQATLDEIDGEATDFIALNAYATSNDLSEDLHFDWVNDRLDINSFVDYFIIQLYVNNRDWPNFNLKVWNAEGQEKWRYLCYDMDVGLKYNGASLIEQQSLAFILNNLSDSNPHVQILEALLDNDEFRRYFINRYCDLLNTIFDPDAIYGSILAQKEKLENDMELHYNKWCGAIADWHERFNGQKGFIAGRELVIHGELSQIFEIPQAVEMTFDVYPTDAATIRLNTLELDDFPFVGSYFNTNKIDLTAEIKFGEIFKYWENLRTGERLETLQIEVDPNDQDHWVVVCHSTEIFELKTVPNPSHNELTVGFSIITASTVEISLVDLQGKVVKSTFYPENFIRGRHELVIDMTDLLAGQYILFLTTTYGREASQIIKL
ncbi:MAG: T9SS type A sorting domain-containing protein [Crocinitomix sp.]|nr:T9SS type A sorting domain-containing protein [Crocinitomix sp.]